MALADVVLGALAVAENNNLLSSTQAADIVAVLNADTFDQVFAAARPMEAVVYERAEVMEHPLETGATIVDHRIITPVEIELPLRVASIDYVDAYNEVKQLYLAGTLLSVQTRTGSYDSMLIAEMPHRETADMLNGVEINLRLKEARFVEPSYGDLPPRKVENQAQASTKKKGVQKTTTAKPSTTAKAVDTTKETAPKPKASSTLYNIFN